MKKEQQDKLWNELSEESQNKLREMAGLNLREDHYLIKDFEKLFGSHNLNPKPPTPKTWEDVEKEYPKILTDFQELNVEITCCCGIANKIGNKMLATAKIAKLIELGYGGMVSEEEWKKSASYDKEDALWTIVCECKKQYQEPQFRIACNWEQVDFLSFHSKELAEEFMSHESNRKLVGQYYLL